MGSNGVSFKQTVPIVDLSELTENNISNCVDIGSPAVTKIVKEIRNACIQWGFFYVIGHGIAPELVANLKKVASDFFHKPKDVKKSVERQPVS